MNRLGRARQPVLPGGRAFVQHNSSFFRSGGLACRTPAVLFAPAGRCACTPACFFIQGGLRAARLPFFPPREACVEHASLFLMKKWLACRTAGVFSSGWARRVCTQACLYCFLRNIFPAAFFAKRPAATAPRPTRPAAFPATAPVTPPASAPAVFTWRL